MKYCECGCKQILKEGLTTQAKVRRFISGHNSYGNKVNLGRELTRRHKNKISQSLLSKKLGGKQHHLYKEEGFSYSAVHNWLRYNFGKADRCDFCGSNRNIDWANKSHNYTRELNDWIKLCKKCHWKYDQVAWGVATKKFNLRKVTGYE